MNIEVHDPRDIPVLTDAIEKEGQALAQFDAKAVHAAIVTEALKAADSLLHQAARDIEAILFERVLDRLRATLPELVDRVLREHAAESADATPPGLATAAVDGPHLTATPADG